MKKINTEIKIFQWVNWEIEFRWDNELQTIWWSLNQISELFWKDKSNISRHIKNIFKSWELSEKQTVAFFATVQKEGTKMVERKIEYYNLDMIISVWYRVNSKQATEFRIWATSVLKDYLINGYAINQKRLQEKWYKDLENTIALVKKSITSWVIWKDEALWLLEIITKYTNTWLLLQKYDEDDLKEKWTTQNINYKLEAKEAYESILELKKDLIKSWQATNLFAQMRDSEWLQSIFWNIYQTFDWVDLYPTVEEKIAHLLYFVVKDHPFSDWNKRSWAFLFILFLAKNNLLFDVNWDRKINDRALVAITLLVAESKPRDKEIMVKLIVNLID